MEITDEVRSKVKDQLDDFLDEIYSEDMNIGRSMMKQHLYERCLERLERVEEDDVDLDDLGMEVQ